ncbi:hypothetical protein KCU78_g1112, partial [Aureobasidium melanogenum]
MTGSIFKLTPLKETAAGDQTTSSWFSSMRPPKQETNTANTTPLFSPLPKTTTADHFTFSKASETKPPKDKETNNQPDGFHALKTAGASNNNTHQGQVQSQKDVPNIASMRCEPRNVFGVLSGSSSLGPSLDKPGSNMGNKLSTDQSVLKSSSTAQLKASGYQGPPKLFSSMTAGLLEPNNIAGNKITIDPTVNGVAKESHKPASIFTQQSSQRVKHNQESPGRTNPSEPMSAKHANPLQSKDTPNASIFGQAMTAASKPAPPASKLKTKSSLSSSTENMKGERHRFMQLHHTSKDKASGADEQLRTTPLVSLTVKETEVIMRILREMAITRIPFSYATFKANLEKEGLQPGQKVMMAMRLNLLESFLDPGCIEASKKTHSKKNDLLSTSPSTLTIVDLSDPFLDAGTTCTLFDILFSVFLSSRPESGLLICLDEAHKFMKKAPAAETFTENLLTVIREQRHNACRVVIATREPTISPKLLDLCSMTFVHRFSSPDWMVTLKNHLAGASDLATAATATDTSNGDDVGQEQGPAALFEKIINLDVGESLLFAPSAVLEVDEEGRKKKLGVGCVKFKTRSRLGADGGQSVLAVRE